MTGGRTCCEPQRCRGQGSWSERPGSEFVEEAELTSASPTCQRYFFVSPRPGFGMRSTTCVAGLLRAVVTVVSRPVLALRPIEKVFELPLAISPSPWRRGLLRRRTFTKPSGRSEDLSRRLYSVIGEWGECGRSSTETRSASHSCTSPGCTQPTLALLPGEVGTSRNVGWLLDSRDPADENQWSVQNPDPFSTGLWQGALCRAGFDLGSGARCQPGAMSNPVTRSLKTGRRPSGLARGRRPTNISRDCDLVRPVRRQAPEQHRTFSRPGADDRVLTSVALDHTAAGR